MRKADVLVFATPIYYYEMCGQMKTMLDRANPLYDSDYQFRDVLPSCISGRNRKSAMDGAIKGISGWIECFPNSKLAGTVFGGGADVVGAIQGNFGITKRLMSWEQKFKGMYMQKCGFIPLLLLLVLMMTACSSDAAPNYEPADSTHSYSLFESKESEEPSAKGRRNAEGGTYNEK